MWLIVLFKTENTIEVIPAHWVKNNICAWPKNDAKKNVERRVIANKFDFNYFASRTFKKNIGKLVINYYYYSQNLNPIRYNLLFIIFTLKLINVIIIVIQIKKSN